MASLSGRYTRLGIFFALILITRSTGQGKICRINSQRSSGDTIFQDSKRSSTKKETQALKGRKYFNSRGKGNTNQLHINLCKSLLYSSQFKRFRFQYVNRNKEKTVGHLGFSCKSRKVTEIEGWPLVWITIKKPLQKETSILGIKSIQSWQNYQLAICRDTMCFRCRMLTHVIRDCVETPNLQNGSEILSYGVWLKGEQPIRSPGGRGGRKTGRGRGRHSTRTPMQYQSENNEGNSSHVATGQQEDTFKEVLRADNTVMKATGKGTRQSEQEQKENTNLAKHNIWEGNSTSYIQQDMQVDQNQEFHLQQPNRAPSIAGGNSSNTTISANLKTVEQFNFGGTSSSDRVPNLILESGLYQMMGADDENSKRVQKNRATVEVSQEQTETIIPSARDKGEAQNVILTGLGAQKFKGPKDDISQVNFDDKFEFIFRANASKETCQPKVQMKNKEPKAKKQILWDESNKAMKEELYREPNEDGKRTPLRNVESNDGGGKKQKIMLEDENYETADEDDNETVGRAPEPPRRE